MPRLVYIMANPISLRKLLPDQLAHFRSLGYEVYALSAPGEDLDWFAAHEGVTAIELPMEREMTPLWDLAAVMRLVRLFRRLRPDIVNAGTPKGGLLGMLAAWLARVPVRIYTLHGLRLETTRGLKRLILSLTERISAGCAQRVICVSESLRRRYLECGCTRADKITVLAGGSCNGVNPALFEETLDPTPAETLRAQWGVPAEAPVVGFVGRFTRDKGIVELVDAFDRVLAARPDAWLLLVGDYEAGDPIPPPYVQRIAQHTRIIRPGYVHDLAPYYAAMTVLAFPTYREGLPGVPLEAAAAGLPTVGTQATGVVDAVVDGQTGTLVPIGDAAALADGLLRYLNDPELRQRHGQAARERARRVFRPEVVWEALKTEYESLLGKYSATGK